MLNMNFTQRVVINTAQQEWVASPMPGVWRKPLEREAKESGHTTSIVKYEAGSRFSTHFHPLGEEILVLEGVFSDENGDYPSGTYIRNPPGSHHAPFSNEGCVILVKLNQFDPQDLNTVRIDINKSQWVIGNGGLKSMPLHEYEREQVILVKLSKGERFQPPQQFGGQEILVLSGEFKDEFATYPKHTWLRSSHSSKHFPRVEQDTIIWVKTGHLPID